MSIATSDKVETKAVKIALNLIKVDREHLQPRVEMDDEHMQRMARAYLDGDDVPPPVHVFWDGKVYWLVDGFHRYKAMWSLRHTAKKFMEIKCYVHEGIKREAIVFAAQANLDNRSKPMNDMDRKKAMWMLLDDEEWRGKMAGAVGSIVGLSRTTARKYWVEYFSSRGLVPPASAKDIVGRKRSVRRVLRTSTSEPCVSRKGNKHYLYIDNKEVYLGTDQSGFQRKIQDARDNVFEKLTKYENSSKITHHLVAGLVHSEAVFSHGSVTHYPGLHGLKIDGIAVVWESFRSKADTVRAIGRAICAREMIGATRTVVLCPVEDGPPEVLALGRKAGIEFMTIEDFVASLQGGDGEPGAETDEEVAG